MKNGFTLLEMMVVVAVITILMCIVLGVSGLATKKSAIARATAEIEQLKNGLENLRVKQGSYPSYTGRLDAAVAVAATLRTALSNNNPKIDLVWTDPWGAGYQYVSQGRFVYKLWSDGPDTNNPVGL